MLFLIDFAVEKFVNSKLPYLAISVMGG